MEWAILVLAMKLSVCTNVHVYQDDRNVNEYAVVVESTQGYVIVDDYVTQDDIADASLRMVQACMEGSKS